MKVGAKSWEDAVSMMRSDLSKFSYDEEIALDFEERRDRALEYIIRALQQSNPGENFRFPVVGSARLKKVWLDYGRSGVVRDEKGLDKIAEQILNNIALLDVTNELGGHSSLDPDELLDRNGFLEYKEQLVEFLVDPDTGSWYVSDYGLPYLHAAYAKIIRAKTPEARLLAVDQALNVVHQRSDLASWFVEGGYRTLQEISEQV